MLTGLSKTDGKEEDKGRMQYIMQNIMRNTMQNINQNIMQNTMQNQDGRMEDRTFTSKATVRQSAIRQSECRRQV